MSCVIDAVLTTPPAPASTCDSAAWAREEGSGKDMAPTASTVRGWFDSSTIEATPTSAQATIVVDHLLAMYAGSAVSFGTSGVESREMDVH